MSVVGLLSALRSFVGTVKKLVESSGDAAAVLGRVRQAIGFLEAASKGRITSDRAIVELDALADLKTLERDLDETRAKTLAELAKRPKK